MEGLVVLGTNQNYHQFMPDKTPCRLWHLRHKINYLYHVLFRPSRCSSHKMGKLGVNHSLLQSITQSTSRINGNTRELHFAFAVYLISRVGNYFSMLLQQRLETVTTSRFD